MISKNEFLVLKNLYIKAGLVALLNEQLGYRDILDILELLEHKGYINSKESENDIMVTNEGYLALLQYRRKYCHNCFVGFIESKKDKWKTPISIDEVYIPK